MYQSKPRKNQKDETSPLTYYITHTIPNINFNVLDEVILLGFDPGMVNPSIHIESRNRNTGQIKSLLNIKFDVYDLYIKNIDRNNNINQAPSVLYDLLEQYKNLIFKCHIIIVEKQLKENYKAVCLSKYFISWCLIYLKNNITTPVICEIDSKAKYRYLNCPKEYNENAKKKWGITKALELCKIRNDTHTYNIIEDSPLSKRDDLADSIIICQAFCIINNVFLYNNLDSIVNIQKYNTISVYKNNPKKPAIYGNIYIE